MPRSPALSFTLSATVYGGVAVSAGQVLLPDANGTYVPATSANRAAIGRRSEAIALTPYGGTSPGGVQLQEAGTLDASVSGLGAGTASWVRCSDAGFPERFTPTNGGFSDIIGYCETDGRLHLHFGIWTESAATATGTPPAGTTGAVQINTGGAFAAVQPNTAGNVLTSNGAGVAPSFQAAASGGASPGGATGTFQRNNGGGTFNGIAGNVSGGPLVAPAALVVGDMYYAASTSALAKLAAGSNGQVLMLAGGVPTWADLPLDPTTLALSGFYRGSYLGTSPWASSGSAGNSGAMSMTQATGTAIPAQGAAVDGFFPCAPDGTDDSLRDNANTAAPYLGSTTYTIAVMFKAPAGVAANANAYADQQIMCGTADIIGISWTSGGVRAWHYDGSNWAFTPLIACSANAWHLVTVTFSGGTLSCRIDMGTPQTVAKGNVVGLAAANIQIGRTSTAGVFDAIQRMELLTAASALSIATLTRYQGYLKARYPSAGLP